MFEKNYPVIIQTWISGRGSCIRCGSFADRHILKWAKEQVLAWNELGNPQDGEIFFHQIDYGNHRLCGCIRRGGVEDFGRPFTEIRAVLTEIEALLPPQSELCQKLLAIPLDHDPATWSLCLASSKNAVAAVKSVPQAPLPGKQQRYPGMTMALLLPALITTVLLVNFYRNHGIHPPPLKQNHSKVAVVNPSGNRKPKDTKATVAPPGNHKPKRMKAAAFQQDNSRPKHDKSGKLVTPVRRSDNFPDTTTYTGKKCRLSFEIMPSEAQPKKDASHPVQFVSYGTELQFSAKSKQLRIVVSQGKEITLKSGNDKRWNFDKYEIKPKQQEPKENKESKENKAIVKADTKIIAYFTDSLEKELDSWDNSGKDSPKELEEYIKKGVNLRKKCHNLEPKLWKNSYEELLKKEFFAIYFPPYNFAKTNVNSFLNRSKEWQFFLDHYKEWQFFLKEFAKNEQWKYHCTLHLDIEDQVKKSQDPSEQKILLEAKEILSRINTEQNLKVIQDAKNDKKFSISFTISFAKLLSAKEFCLGEIKLTGKTPSKQVTYKISVSPSYKIKIGASTPQEKEKLIIIAIDSIEIKYAKGKDAYKKWRDCWKRFQEN